MLNILNDYLCHIGNTVLFMYQQPFSQVWDRLLTRILVSGEVVCVSEYTITFRYSEHEVEIWTANRWYAFAHLHCLNGKYPPSFMKTRPRFRTMRCLHAISELYRHRLTILPDVLSDPSDRHSRNAEEF